MDAGVKKLLDSVTIETLHAHNFSRSSTQAANVLTDLLSRYLTLLSATCSRYAHHAGRLRLTARDAINALDELGLGVDELSEYCASEARDLARYSSHTTRRAEDLRDFKGQSSRAHHALRYFMLYFISCLESRREDRTGCNSFDICTYVQQDAVRRRKRR